MSCREIPGSNVAASQKVERPVFAAVGCLELVTQAELPLVLQFQPGDGLTQRTSVLADHTQSGSCGHEWGQWVRQSLRQVLSTSVNI